jgi:uncharacterized membrane protein YjjP (DUF1212 family)
MYWGWDIIIAFLVSWIIGAGLFVLARKVNAKAPQRKRVIICALVLAAAFTPSIVLQHASAILPAIVVLVMSPFVPAYGWTYGLVFGALPIGIAWLAIALIWVGVVNAKHAS